MTKPTPENIRKMILEDYANNIQSGTIAKKYNINKSTVVTLVKRFGGKARGPGETTSVIWDDPDFEQKILTKYAELHIVADVARYFGAGTERIRKIIQDYNISTSKRKIITPFVSKQILDLWFQGETSKSIGNILYFGPNIIRAHLASHGINTKIRCDPKRENFLQYQRIVRSYSTMTYRRFKHIINPANLTTGQLKYHKDHIRSIRDSYDENIDPVIVAHYSNIQMLHQRENNIKKAKSHKTLDDLVRDYNKAQYTSHSIGVYTGTVICFTYANITQSNHDQFSLMKSIRSKMKMHATENLVMARIMPNITHELEVTCELNGLVFCIEHNSIAFRVQYTLPFNILYWLGEENQ